MLRSLYSGVSGLRAHQTMMDVVGNNIANVNTVGYKTDQTLFEDTLSQELKAASAAQGGTAGTNPAQVGLGVKLATIATNFAQGSFQNTGTATNMAIQGDGFFMVKQGGQDLYTRAGDFTFDDQGTLTTPDGGIVQGWPANTAGVINNNTTPTDLTVPLGITMGAQQTTTATVVGNLPSGTTTGNSVSSGVTMYDTKGAKVPITFTYTATGTDSAGNATWDMSAVDGSGTVLGTNSLTFDSSGKLIPTGAATTSSPVSFTINGANVDVDISQLTEYAGSSTATVTAQNGSQPGSLQSFSIGQDGIITGVFSNGLKQSLGQVSLAAFNNPDGLEKVGDTDFRATVNSGLPQVGTALNGNRGSIASGEVEMSNVDLGEEFTQLIVAQRGFEANSKVIKASDEILQDLVNMK